MYSENKNFNLVGGIDLSLKILKFSLKNSKTSLERN